MGYGRIEKAIFPQVIFQTGRRTETNGTPSEKKRLSVVLFREARTGRALNKTETESRFFSLALRLFRCAPQSESETSGGKLFFQEWNNQPE